MGQLRHSHGNAEALKRYLPSFIAIVAGAIFYFFAKSYFPQTPPIYSQAVGAFITVLILALWYAKHLIFHSLGSHFGLRTVAAQGSRLGVYVACIEGDDDGTARRSVIDSIANEVSRDVVEVIPTSLTLRLSDRASEENSAFSATEKARKLLLRKHGDLLVWGRVHSIANHGTCIELRFVSASLDGTNGKRFAFDSVLTLQPDFGMQMRAALVSTIVALALPAKKELGTYLVERLSPFADKLKNFVADTTTPLRRDEREQVLEAYARIQLALGLQTGDLARLTSAAACAREAMKEELRERDPKRWVRVMNTLANTLDDLGESNRDIGVLREALAAWDQLEDYFAEGCTSYNWAVIESNRGATLRTLGVRENCVPQLKEAICAHRCALKVIAGSDEASLSAKIQIRLASALTAVGEYTGDAAYLEEAIAVCKAGLTGMSRGRSPLDWSISQHCLGAACFALGRLKGDTTILHRAATAYRNALSENTREKMPLHWGQTRHMLGVALGVIGDEEASVDWLRDSVDALREALEELERQRAPFLWADTKHDLAVGLRNLGELTNNDELVKEAIAVCHECLAVRTRDQDPMMWALTKHWLGVSLRTLGVMKFDAAAQSGAQHFDSTTLTNSILAFQDALLERTQGRAPLAWAETMDALGGVLMILGNCTSDLATLDEAASVFRKALTERTRERVPLLWSATRGNLATALLFAGQISEGTARLEEARDAVSSALAVTPRGVRSHACAAQQNTLAGVLLLIGERRRDMQSVEAAICAFQSALSFWTKETAPGPYKGAIANLKKATRIRDELRGGAS